MGADPSDIQKFREMVLYVARETESDRRCGAARSS
jgi:hypothetical protein